MYKEHYKETEEKLTCDQPSKSVDFKITRALLSYIHHNIHIKRTYSNINLKNPFERIDLCIS